jgi:glycosyltransferase involved in cell wall biosynthesis
VKILLITQYFWPESFRINDLIRAWREQQHDVTVLTGFPNYPAGRFFSGYSLRGPYRQTYSGARVRRLPIIRRGAQRGVRLVLNYVSFVCSGIILGPLLARHRYDATFVFAPSPVTQCIPAIWLRFLRRIPVVLWLQDLWPDTLVAVGVVRGGWPLQVMTALSRWIYRRCDLILVSSPALVDGVRRVCPDVNDLRVLVNWADDFYCPQTVEADAPERREMPSGFTIMFAGNLGSAQALDVAIAAAEMLRDEGVHWVFIGDGNQREFLERERRVRRLENVVTLLGSRPAEAMPRYLSLADALLVSLRPDPTFASTVPAKLQSSLAVGRPVLAALDGEGARIVREADAGIVVAQNDPQALADGVRALLRAQPADRERMGANGRRYAAQHFDRRRQVAQLNEWMRDVSRARV